MQTTSAADTVKKEEAPAGTPGKIVSAGKPTAATLNSKPVETTDTGTAAADTGASAAKPDTDSLEDKNKKPTDISNEQLVTMLEERGIKFDGGLDGLKKKLENPDAPLTDEQKAANESAFEKRMLDHFIENKGTAEQFVALKQIAEGDLKSLSEKAIYNEMKESGFDDSEISLVLKERYYQINPEELEQGSEESTAEFEKRKAAIEKKIAYGSKKLEAKGTFIKTQATQALEVLREAIKGQDLQKVEEAKTLSMVDEVAKTLPRKFTFELGMVNDKPIDPIHYDVSETDVAEVTADIKDPAKRNNFLFNQDGSLNLTNISNVMLKNKILESVIKASFSEGIDRQVAEFEKIFPGRTAKDIGVGGNNTGNQGGRKGHIVSAGKPQVVRR